MGNRQLVCGISTGVEIVHTFRKKSGIYIPSEFENNTFYTDIKESLVRRAQHYQNSTFSYYKFYLESDKGLLIPRFFPVSDYVPCRIENFSYPGEDISFGHNISPRSELQDKAMKHMLTNDSGIMQLQPGVGKTVISIYVIAMRKKKSLILVHRDSLVDQWRKEFRKFTSLPHGAVMRLTSQNFEEALTKPVIMTTAQTFISLLKRNRVNFLQALHKANLGVFIADEVHTSVGAPTFSECSIHTPANVIFGLSATPYRWDGNSDIIEMHLGDIYVDDDTYGTMKPRIVVILRNFGITKKSSRYIYWGGKFQRARYLNLMKNAPLFMATVKGLLMKYKDRELVLTGDRIKLLDYLYDWFPGSSKSKFTQNAGNDQLEAKITFATSMKIRDGVNIPKKDCLIMTSPVSNVEQMIGRVCRTSEGKEQPIVIDMVDIGCWDICRSLRYRLDFYREKKWEAKFVYIDDKNKSQMMNEEEATDLIKNMWEKKSG